MARLNFHPLRGNEVGDHFIMYYNKYKSSKYVFNIVHIYSFQYFDSLKSIQILKHTIFYHLPQSHFQTVPKWELRLFDFPIFMKKRNGTNIYISK
jgi:hypothetical protein